MNYDESYDADVEFDYEDPAEDMSMADLRKEVERLRNDKYNLEKRIYEKKCSDADANYAEACMEYEDGDTRLNDEWMNRCQDKAEALLEYDPDSYAEQKFFGNI
jgi:hypothetical protein